MHHVVEPFGSIKYQLQSHLYQFIKELHDVQSKFGNQQVIAIGAILPLTISALCTLSFVTKTFHHGSISTQRVYAL